jgi:hypothetical protein
MKAFRIGSLLAMAGCLATGCASSPPRPAAKAASVERMQCEAGDAALGQDLLGSAKVLDVQPLYAYVPTLSNNNTDERIHGAKLLVRPPPGVSAEQMTRALQCRTASIWLGQVPPAEAANDPYWLPDAWTRIRVTPEDGNFSITVEADSTRDDLRVFRQVHLYARQRMLAGDPVLPR